MPANSICKDITQSISIVRVNWVLRYIHLHGGILHRRRQLRPMNLPAEWVPLALLGLAEDSLFLHPRLEDQVGSKDDQQYRAIQVCPAKHVADPAE